MHESDFDRLPTTGERVAGFAVGLILFASSAAAAYAICRLMLTRGALPALVALLAVLASVGFYAISLMLRTLLGRTRKSGAIGLLLLGTLMSAIGLAAIVAWWISNDVRFLGYVLAAGPIGAAFLRQAWWRHAAR